MTSPPPPLLIVEDEPDLRQLYTLALVKAGVDAEAVPDLAQAHARLRERRYAVVLTDMRLPDGTGLELLRALAREGRSERAIVITAYGSADNAVEALKAGAFDYLTKPVAPARLRQAVAAALAAGAPGPDLAAHSPLGAGSVSSPIQPSPSSPHAASTAAHTARSQPSPPPSTTTPPLLHPAATDPGADSAIALPPETSAAGAALRRTPSTSGATVWSAPPTAGAPAPPALARLIGDSPAMQAVRATILRVARTMAPVLVTGESGTGKELIARALHACSHRAGGPFVAVNCGAIPADLLESELFGHRRGAFTGAHSDKLGLFQAAAGGTLFLDEVSDLPLPMQVKLLRALQERAVRPVGATAEEPVDVRIVSATHKDLERLVQTGQFRHDLYYRLNVIPIRAPALREHPEDLEAIAAAVLAQLTQRDGLPHVPALTDAALARLRAYPFPGNVRELENLLERALALHPGAVLDADAFPLPGFDAAPPLAGPSAAPHGTSPNRTGAGAHMASALHGMGVSAESAAAAITVGAAPSDTAPAPDGDTTATTEPPDAPLPRAQLEALLQRNRWNQSRTARELGWTLAKLRYWMQRLRVG
ncbi:sigma-54-dependent transcriptional regulator [Tepidimonas taiwanensis]|uniref:sigma-54-dependent transcriptional regulator n=1 Tax=Tepidimonas taiwanensis TaxID=307486 RepID=UPI000733EFE1|nr:sigma-54 dependent transcriptional regulator [Tepidimonas taiwanensis]